MLYEVITRLVTSGPRIFLSAGEPSGDLHAGAVARAILDRFPDATIDAFGGPHLAAAGARILYPMERYTVMGFNNYGSSLVFGHPQGTTAGRCVITSYSIHYTK